MCVVEVIRLPAEVVKFNLGFLVLISVLSLQNGGKEIHSHVIIVQFTRIARWIIMKAFGYYQPMNKMVEVCVFTSFGLSQWPHCEYKFCLLVIH